MIVMYARWRFYTCPHTEFYLPKASHKKEAHGFDSSVGANPALTGGQKSQT